MIWSKMRTVRGRPCSRAATVRALSSSARDPHMVLSLPAGAPRALVRQRYFDLAKQRHPDVLGAAGGAGDPCAAFVELHVAFEALMRAASVPSPSPQERSAASSSARGAGGAWARSRAASARPMEPRSASLAEVLAARLIEEPESVESVWAEITSRRLDINAQVADMLFRACSRNELGMAGALRLLREATSLGLFPQGIRSAALVSLLTWCKEDELDATFEVCDEITDDDKTPEVLAALSAAFSYFGGVGASF